MAFWLQESVQTFVFPGAFALSGGPRVSNHLNLPGCCGISQERHMTFSAKHGKNSGKASVGLPGWSLILNNGKSLIWRIQGSDYHKKVSWIFKCSS